MYHTIYVHTFVPRALPYNEPVPFPKLGPSIAHAIKICTGKPFPNSTCIRVGLASWRSDTEAETSTPQP